jgi:mannose-6-phosphate isomerase-like protein (cupin superfamily)
VSVITNVARRIPPTSGRFVLGDRNQLKLGASDTGEAFSLLYTKTPPGKGPPLHVHEREDEVFCVLAGHYRFTCGDQVFDARPGHVARLPRFIPHTFRNLAPSFGRLLEFVVPGGIERYFDRINYLGAEAASNLTERAQVAREFGLYFGRDSRSHLGSAGGVEICHSSPVGAGPVVERDGCRITAKVGAQHSRGRCTVLEVELDAGAAHPSLEWEGRIVLWGVAGELEVHVEAATLGLGPAVAVALTPGARFELVNQGSAAGRALLLSTPAGIESHLGFGPG